MWCDIRTLCLVGTLALAIGQVPCAVADPAHAHGKAADPALRRFDDFVTQQLRTWDVPGAAVAIVKDGKVIFAQGFGYRDLDKRLKVTPDTLFNIGSTAKAFTAMSVGQLVDEGRLSWDTPVRHHLPTFRLVDSFATERMTPRDLLTHRSGLPAHDVAWLSAEGHPTRQELMQRLQYLEPSQEFRTTFQYSNLSYLVASELVAKVSGKSWDRWVQTRIFDPLGMSRSNLSEAQTRQSADFALPYAHDDDARPLSPDVKVYGRVVPLFFQSYENCGGCASIYSNIVDMARWLLLHLEGGQYGGARIISPAALREMHSPQMLVTGGAQSPQLLMPRGYEEMPFEGYGFGWFISSYRGHSLLWHTGGAMGLSAMVSIMPKERLGIVVLTNMHRTPLRRVVVFNSYDRLLGLEPAPWGRRFKDEEAKVRAAAQSRSELQRKERLARDSARPARPLGDYTGSYFNPGYGTLTVGADGKGLSAVANGYTSRFLHDSDDLFVIDHAEVRGLAVMDADFQIAGLAFKADAEGRIRGVIVKGQSPEDLDVEFVKVLDSAER